MTRLPANLPELLRDAGLDVVVVEDWQTRGRPPSTGDFAPVGVLNHHTGASARGWDRVRELAYAKWMFLVGRGSELPPPLCQIALGRSGTVYVGAAGRANHAGVALASGSVSGGDGNALYIGIEWMLSGTEEIPALMMKAGATLNAVLTEKVTRTTVQTVSCHYQTSVTGKWDIGDPNGVPFKGHMVLDVEKFREDVAAERKRMYRSGATGPGLSLPKIPKRGLVMDKGPSDHTPYVRDIWLSRAAKSRVRLGGWNVNHDSTAEDVAPTLRKMQRLGVEVFLFNEVKIKSGILDLLRNMGYEVAYNDPEFCIAWLPGVVTEIRERDLVMSEHNYWLDKNEALLVVLEHKATGIRFRAISEHPPAHISRRNHPTFENVLAVHKDVAAKNLAIAQNSELPVVIFRDSNIDPVKDKPVYTTNWNWAYKGYKYLRAPKPTRAKRHIDEFLIVRLRARRFLG